MADPTRARTLSCLLDGRLHTAGELASHAGVTAATMSAHLKLLVDEGLARVLPRGRHRYFGLAGESVAHALEAMLQVADGAAADLRRWQRPAMQGLRHARTCYGHLAGVLGVQLHTVLLQRGWVQPLPQGGDYGLTAAGRAALSAQGLLHGAGDAAGPQATPRGAGRELYNCVDWSERREHFAGHGAVALLKAFIDKGWLARSEGSRELVVTPRGQAELLHGLLKPQ